VSGFVSSLSPRKKNRGGKFRRFLVIWDSKKNLPSHKVLGTKNLRTLEAAEGNAFNWPIRGVRGNYSSVKTEPKRGIGREIIGKWFTPKGRLQMTVSKKRVEAGKRTGESKPKRSIASNESRRLRKKRQCLIFPGLTQLLTIAVGGKNRAGWGGHKS